MPTKLEAVLEKAARGERLTAKEQARLELSEAQWDALKEARHADEATLEQQPAGRPDHVHRERGLVEVLVRTPEGWRYRPADDFSVDTAAPGAFRAVITAKAAAALLERLQVTLAAPKLPTDAERRARLRAPIDLLDLAALEREYLYFRGVVCGGAALWTMEKVPCRRIRQHLVDELSLALGEAVTLVE